MLPEIESDSINEFTFSVIKTKPKVLISISFKKHLVWILEKNNLKMWFLVLDI